MRAAVERLAALIRRRLSRNPNGHEYPAVQCALAHRVVAVVGEKDRVVRPDGRAVRPFEDAVAPGAQKIAVPIEHDDRMFSAREAVNLIFVIHGYGGDFMKRPIVRQLAPTFDHFVTVLTASYDDA